MNDLELIRMRIDWWERKPAYRERERERSMNKDNCS
jgi:hypothetical protein